MMQDGEMASLSALAKTSARFQLDHGPALRTGLAGEHVATGLSPADSRRWAAVHFDPRSYDTWQEGTSMAPFPTGLPLRTVVFDTPYFDLEQALDVQGIVNGGLMIPECQQGPILPN